MKTIHSANAGDRFQFVLESVVYEPLWREVTT